MSILDNEVSKIFKSQREIDLTLHTVLSSIKINHGHAQPFPRICCSPFPLTVTWREGGEGVVGGSITDFLFLLMWAPPNLLYLYNSLYLASNAIFSYSTFTVNFSWIYIFHTFTFFSKGHSEKGIHAKTFLNSGAYFS